jgi:hypothetical protein
MGYGWTEGCIEGIRFHAKLYDAGSRFGINNGRVGTLAAWIQTKGSANGLFASYDMGWSKIPDCDDLKEFLIALVGHLETLPTSENINT